MKICPRDGHSYYYIPGNGACQNGLSLTIGTDDGRSKSLMNLTGAGVPNFGTRPGGRQGEPWSDPFISLRTDQAWGYGALVGGAHHINAAYTGDNSALGSPALGGLSACLQPGALGCGRLNDKPGYFMALGGELKMPIFGAGDRVGAGVRYSQGGSSGFGGGNVSGPDLFGAGNTPSAGWLPDNGSGIELTSAWSVQAGYDHQWSPSLNTSLFAGYANVTVDTDPGNYFAGAVCGVERERRGRAGRHQLQVQLGQCRSRRAHQLGAGARSDPVGADHVQLRLVGVHRHRKCVRRRTAARPTESYNFANQGVWSSYLRINRTFNTGD